MSSLIIEPEFFVDFLGKIHTGCIEIHGNKITAITKNPDQSRGKRRLRLKNQVIFPGFVNAHSHAFQRALRGLTERRSPQFKDHFFTWREEMYRLANLMTKDELVIISELAYLEMIEAGFTHVGEFHYLHHDVGGTPFKDPIAISRALATAATNAGINLCLLECAYHRHDFDEPIKSSQKRFFFHRVNDFLDLLKLAKDELHHDSVSVGVAIHSVRAVPTPWFSPINEWALAHNLPLHIHASEQKLDVAHCLTAEGLSPLALLARHHMLAPHVTLVHAIHLLEGDKELIVKHRPTICVCPSTEKNLGDGMARLSDLFSNGVKVCLGTDQHVRFDPFCEARSLEDQERLRLLERSVLPDAGAYLFSALLPCLTTSGMASLMPGHEYGSLLGQAANLVAVELPPEYEWHGPEVALEAIVLSHQPSQINHVFSNGELVLENGQLKCKEKSYLINEIRTFFKKLNPI